MSPAALMCTRTTLASAAVSCVLVLAACGSSNGPTATGPEVSAALLRYSQCIRAHGVPGFPDPSTNQGPNAIGIDGYNFNLPANLNLQAPAYESANQACGNLISGGGGGPARNPALVAKAKRAALAHAQCMRAHGVASFPDPSVSGNGQGITVRSGGGGLDPRSPAFRQAQRACQPQGR